MPKLKSKLVKFMLSTTQCRYEAGTVQAAGTKIENLSEKTSYSWNNCSSVYPHDIRFRSYRYIDISTI